MKSASAFRKVLVLNASFLPINITSWRRALILLFKGKAEKIEMSDHLVNQKYPVPYVIRLLHYVPVPYNDVVLTRKNVYLRDNHICQYCGKNGNLTLDHVIPKSRSGSDTWENVVTCCARCNNRKADRTLEDSGLRLRNIPYKPPSSLYLQVTRFGSMPDCWLTYFFDIKRKN